MNRSKYSPPQQQVVGVSPDLAIAFAIFLLCIIVSLLFSHSFEAQLDVFVGNGFVIRQ